MVIYMVLLRDFLRCVHRRFHTAGGRGLSWGHSSGVPATAHQDPCCAANGHHIKRCAGLIALGFPRDEALGAGGEADLPNGDHCKQEISELLHQASAIQRVAATVIGAQIATRRAMDSNGVIAFSLICSHRRWRGAPSRSLS